MITSQLLHPASIVVVGASNNVHKPGGAILKNLLSGGYTGELRAVNPKETEVQGVAAFADVKDIPDTDLAILAIPAALCPDAVEMLAAEKQVKAFIILSAGFGEETHFHHSVQGVSARVRLRPYGDAVPCHCHRLHS